MEGRLYAEASKSGYLIKGADDSNLLSDMGGFMAGHIDLTNQSACQWLRQILIDNVFSLGFSGVITDRLDYLPKAPYSMAELLLQRLSITGLHSGLR